MRRMFSLKQLQEIAKNSIENAPSLELKSINAEQITGNSIIENMSGYSAEIKTRDTLNVENVYTSIVKNGNKLTIVSALNVKRTDTISGSFDIVNFYLPQDILAKLYPTIIGSYSALAFTNSNFIVEDNTAINLSILLEKQTNKIICYLQGGTITNLPLNKRVYVRIEATFLLSDNLIS